MYGLARTRAPRCGRPLDYTHTADRSWPRLDSRQTYYWVRVTLCYIAIALHVYVAAASARPRLRGPVRVRITYARANTRRSTARYVYRIVYEWYIYVGGSFVWLFNTFAAYHSVLCWEMYKWIQKVYFQRILYSLMMRFSIRFFLNGNFVIMWKYWVNNRKFNVIECN